MNVRCIFHHVKRVKVKRVIRIVNTYIIVTSFARSKCVYGIRVRSAYSNCVYRFIVAQKIFFGYISCTVVTQICEIDSCVTFK